MKKKEYLVRFGMYVFLTIIAIVVLIPMYYLFVTTFKTGTEAAVNPMGLPSSFRLEGYIEAFEKMQYPRAFKNTFFITVTSVAGIILSSSMCGYVLNRKDKNPAAKFIFVLILSGMMFPYQMEILGLYKLVQNLNLMNTFAAVILIDIAINIPFATFLMKNYISSVPLELEEAARIDGAGVFRIFTTITFPLLKPVVATVAILNTLNIWNDFMGPLYFLQKRENGVLLQEVYRNIGQFSTDWNSMFPMLVLAVLPLLIFYLFMQRYIIGGVMAGSVKG